VLHSILLMPWDLTNPVRNTDAVSVEYEARRALVEHVPLERCLDLCSLVQDGVLILIFSVWSS
jgi:hypothetical protein